MPPCLHDPCVSFRRISEGHIEAWSGLVHGGNNANKEIKTDAIALLQARHYGLGADARDVHTCSSGSSAN